MDTVFPFGLPAPTAFYLSLYVLTFALHQAFMHYVLAGSFYVAWATLLPGRGEVPRAAQPLAAALRDWMPFLLSAAITAGVAPLLFIQIVYPRAFYTANLLLAWRWMIVIPVLIVAFYLLYLAKSARFAHWPYVPRAAVVLLVAAGVLFVGFCWTANYLLANNAAQWPEIYVSGEVVRSASTVVLRMLVWAGGACAGLSVIAGWQLVGPKARVSNGRIAPEMRRLACFSLGGLAIATIAGSVFVFQSGETIRGLIFGAFALPYTIAAIVGVVLQIVGWTMQWRSATSRMFLGIATAGYVLSLLGVSVLRETIRLAGTDLAALDARLAAACQIGGFAVFVIFAAINAAIIAGCIWLVRRGLRDEGASG